MYKTCATCIENDDGLCDRKGVQKRYRRVM